MTDGIYTLANDVVYDQLVALLNSIEANADRDIPVCVIPYNDQLDRVKAEITQRKNVTLFEDQATIEKWENFARQAWTAHQRAQKIWQERGLAKFYRLAMHRKLCGLDGIFDKFIYFDADTLLLGPLEEVYQKLEQYQWVTYDFQYLSDIKYIFDGSKEDLEKIFSPEQLKSDIFCAGWFASHKHAFFSQQLEELLRKLKSGEADVMALFGPDQSLFNYMVLRSGISYYNFANYSTEQTTGNHWSSQFDEIDHVLHDQGKQLTYLHYMSIPSSKFTALCAGKDMGIPYQDLFLHYRYLKSPEQRPQLVPPSQLEKSKQSISKFINQKVGNLQYKLRQISH